MFGTGQTDNLGDLFPPDRVVDDPWLIEATGDGKDIFWTYGDLVRQADALALGLQAAGHAPGTRMSIVAENSARYLITYFAIMRGGYCAVPVNFKLPDAAITHIHSDAGVVLAFTDAAHSGQVPGQIPQVRMDTEAWSALLAEGTLELAQLDADAFANILYTSGSTGVPKGVPLTHGGFRYALRAALEGFAQEDDDVAIVAAPLYHMNGLFFSKMVVAGGAQCVMLPRFEARAYLEAIARHRCTLLTGIPTMAALFLRETDLIEKLDLSSIKTIVIGSAPVTKALMTQLAETFPGVRIANSYGTTESGPTAFMPHPDGRPTPWPAIGVASKYVELELRDGPSDDEGTLWVKSPVVMPGYLNLPGKTASALRDGWYCTGDVMRRDAEGFFYFVDRADDMFVCGGENIHPGDVEAMLLRHPAVAEVVVVPVPDSIKGMLPAAYVVRQPGLDVTADEIKAFALKHAPAYQHPRFVTFLDALPLSGTNKPDRKALTAQAESLSRDTMLQDKDAP
ncbi:MAG: class I adenylate-forming enzyme family protein [Pseudomonadota bacterium]